VIVKKKKIVYYCLATPQRAPNGTENIERAALSQLPTRRRVGAMRAPVGGAPRGLVSKSAIDFVVVAHKYCVVWTNKSSNIQCSSIFGVC
jgi:hypothetical protein